MIVIYVVIIAEVTKYIVTLVIVSFVQQMSYKKVHLYLSLIA
jgi:hypothetical protein